MKYKELFDKVKIDSSAKDRIENKMYILKFGIEVGTEEKHTVEFMFNRFWGYVDIKVDGQPYKQKIILAWLLKQTRTYEIKIGEIEKHNVRIDLTRSLFPVGIRECSAWVYVDGEKTDEFYGTFKLGVKGIKMMSFRTKMVTVLPLLLVVAVLIFLIIYSLPISIDKELNGILFRAGASEPDYSQPINIKIEGKYYRRLFTTYNFKGSIDVSEWRQDADLEVLQDKSSCTINIGKPVFEGYWDNNTHSFGHSIDGGLFFMKPDTNEIMIIVFERDETGQAGTAGGQNGLYYAAPCNTREEALEIVNDIYPTFLGKEMIPVE